MTREEIEKLIRGWDLKGELDDENVIIIQKGKDEKVGEMEVRELVFGDIDYIAAEIEVFPVGSAESEIIPFDSIVAFYPIRNQKEVTELAIELVSHLAKLVINLSLLQKVFTPIVLSPEDEN